MKVLKFWGLILVSVMCVGLTSCGGDDNGSPTFQIFRIHYFL